MNLGRICKLGVASMVSAVAVILSVSLVSAASFTLKIGSGQPMMPLEPINQAHHYLVPTIEKRVGTK